MILKNPEPEDLEMLKDGSVYFTMLHYATRHKVREIIQRKGLRTFAMDHIVDDNGLRIFADYFGTAFNACQTAVEALKEVYPDFYSKDRGPIKALVKGVEGTITGLPGHMVIYPDDPAYSEIEGTVVDSTNRRVTVSCNAWPGVDVQRSVQVYYGLMKNYVGIILTKEYEDISEDSDNLFERGLYRSTFTYFMDHWKK